MCKKFVLFVLVLLAIAAALPYGMGYIVQREDARTMSRLASNNVGVDIQLNTYERGWLHSTADYTMTALQSKATDKPGLQLQWKEKITHGPLLFSKNGQKKIQWGKALVDVSFSVPQALLQSLGLRAEPATLLVGQFLVDFKENIQGQLAIPSFALKVDGYEGMVPLQFNDLKINLAAGRRLEHQFTEMRYDLAMGQMVAMLGTLSAGLSDLAQHGDYKRDPHSQLWLGKTDLTVGKVYAARLSVPDHSSKAREFLLTGLQVNADTNITNDLLNNTQAIDIASITMDGVNYGPVVWHVALQNLDAQAAAQLIDLIRNHPSDPAQQQQFTQSMMELLPILLGRGAVFQLKPAMIKTPEGDFKIEANVVFPIADPQAAGAGNAQLALLLAKMTVDVTVKIAKPLFVHMAEEVIGKEVPAVGLTQDTMPQQITTEMASAETDTASPAEMNTEVSQPQTVPVQVLIDHWVQDGVLVDAGSEYRMVFVYKEGQAQLNGQDAKAINSMLGSMLGLNRP
jgi:uncharacterized protein YdgA (DUF945 family)